LKTAALLTKRARDKRSLGRFNQQAGEILLMPTALIVEDEREANKLLSMLVQLRGYQTESAFDGAEALQKVGNRIPDVVFLDLMLPDLDGYDVCRALKTSGTTSQIPVIIVTARMATENRIQSFSAGADDYIPKPYTPDQIFEALDQSQTWKRDIAAPRIEGQAVLDGRDDGETLRRLAQIRNLLLARTRLGLRAIEGINSAIRAVWSNVDQWAQGRRLEQGATLAYELTAESLTLTIHDEGGWLASWPSAAGDPISSLVADGRFDQVVADSESHCLRLVKRLDTGAADLDRGKDR
jgi:CheY-like chemotaxis protein